MVTRAAQNTLMCLALRPTRAPTATAPRHGRPTATVALRTATAGQHTQALAEGPSMQGEELLTTAAMRQLSMHRWCARSHNAPINIMIRSFR